MHPEDNVISIHNNIKNNYEEQTRWEHLVSLLYHKALLCNYWWHI